MGWQRSWSSLVLSCFVALTSAPLALALEPINPNWPTRWDLVPEFATSLEVQPVRESAFALESVKNPSNLLKLAIKRYARAGAQPVLLVHGLSQNDRGWDSEISQYSIARFLHAQGFDVWIGNLRGAGTPGYESEKPRGAERWTVEHYAAYDVPAWAFSGYLSGLTLTENGARAHPTLARIHQSLIRGVATISGVYNAWWPKSVHSFATDPVRNERDFYASNYELELAAQSRPLIRAVSYLPAVPLDWVEQIVHLRLGDLPFIGSQLERLYRGALLSAIDTPILSMLYHARNSDPEMVRLHVTDGMDDISPLLLEQLANSVRERELLGHYDGDRPRDVFSYGTANRGERAVPLLFFAGTHDRLANIEMVRRDGFEAARAVDKTFLAVESAGHLDILTGKTSARDMMVPLARWMRARQ